jgi:hypothetical protein
VVWGRVERGSVYGEDEVEDMRTRVQECLADAGEI